MEKLNRLLNSRYFWIGFAALTVFVYFFGLTIPLLGPDEPRYAQVAREMFERSDWITPTLGGHHWFEKPALLYWMEIAFFNVFGVNEFAARFGPALFGLGIVACLWIVGRFTFSEQQRRAANYFGLVAASTLGFLVFARGASFDITLTFPIAAAMTGFFVFDRSAAGTKSRVLGLLAFYVFMGVSVLAKGLVGFVFPFAIVGFYYLLSLRLPERQFIISLFWGIPVSILVLSTWYLPMYLRHGWEFIDEFFVQHHFQRYTSNKYKHPQPFHFFFWVLPLMTIPWIPFFFVGLWRSFKEIIAGFGQKAEADADTDGSNTHIGSALKFGFAWLAVPLVFFSFSGSKLPGYILPAVPGAMILAALTAWFYARRSPLRDNIVKSLALATFVVVLALLQFALPRFAETDSVRHMFRDAADAGYSSQKVAGFMTISHNMEFYAPGRILRNADGTQRRFSTPDELAAVIREKDEPQMVIVRQEHLHHLENFARLDIKVISRGGDYALAAVEGME
ncbi:MAG: glycosyltransferase family 39 protein [Acidobacteria bacterium]|nr:glycosyltransferase family 39 protein [Acidobacteriota bacterium]